jgi:type IV pilus assembly protein PilE
MKRNERGFTLMELMVVIVIVAILAAVAVPLYINYVKDAQRTEAKGAIGAIISAEQVYFQKNGSYLTTGVGTTATIETNLGIDLTESKKNWAFGIAASGAGTDGFKVTATGQASTPADKLGVTYTHSRTTGPDWKDEVVAAPPGT